MVEAGLQGPDIPMPLPPPAQPAQQAPQQSAQLAPQPSQQGQHLGYLYWSHFKPEFSGKPEEDAESHLLRTNDWMNAHHFLEHIKVQRFCLTLVVARLWYESLQPTDVDRQGIQNLFKQQYSKIGNTREQLFHSQRSFHFDENTETIDAYITCIRQIASLLDHGEAQILEVFKNTLPTKLYWVLFPIGDLRQVVETVKRILTKEKIDR